MKYPQLNVFDFELIKAAKTEIVQVGLAVVDLNKKEVTKNIGFYVKPQSMEGYTYDFFKLTGIKQKLIEYGLPLQQVIDILNVKYGLKSRPFVCFGKDWKCLIEECYDKNIKIEIDNVFDLSLFLTLIHKNENNMSLHHFLTSVKLNFEGQQHNAVADAFNTARLFLHHYGTINLSGH